WTNASDAEVYQALQQYYLVSSAVLFVSLLITHLLAGRIYRSALFKAIRKGRVTREMLHPRLKDWFDRLRIYPVIEPAPEGLVRVARAGGRWVYRKATFVAMFVICVLFVAKGYVGEFLNYHPVEGFLNHPMIQLPHVNYTPKHLSDAAK